MLETFDTLAADTLAASPLMHADETGVNVNGKTIWLHSAANDRWTHFRVPAKRGTEAMDDIGILPRFNGILCHDHGKPYFTYGCTPALCNAHHLRALERAGEQDHQTFALQQPHRFEKVMSACRCGRDVLCPDIRMRCHMGELLTDLLDVGRCTHRSRLCRSSPRQCGVACGNEARCPRHSASAVHPGGAESMRLLGLVLSGTRPWRNTNTMCRLLSSPDELCFS